ncbi:DUF5677 domain-containing protein [Rhizobium sp. BK491]|uniref:DUF5677 domain-containing protein n=1 Tax=Rhizobium sp. BK491 TaxID=2587009 RepID=UPI001610F1D3|nr:DUF5677 domain-containing protein [Rhizobium sp. BK491]MBB3567595.1 hypothetical protein [Rhizobium sp. BK491]
MLNHLTELHTLAVISARRLRFNKDDEVQRVLIALYATIIEQSGSIIIILCKKKSAGVDVILRSIFEAYVDLKALLGDPGYIHNMNAAFYHEWLRLFKNESSSKIIEENDDIRQMLTEYETELAELKKNGHRPLTNQDRIKRADLPKEWLITYNILCSESHNNLRSLMDRHMDMSSGTLEINLSNPNKDITLPLFTAAEILLSSSLDIHTKFEGGHPECFEPVRAKMLMEREAM